MQGLSSHVFMTERDRPMTPKAFHALVSRIGSRAKMQFPIHPHRRGRPLGGATRCLVNAALAPAPLHTSQHFNHLERR
jgi:hypothetical protein